MPGSPVCGWCYDGLCEDHERDCVFLGLPYPIPCACPNLSEEPHMADLEFEVAKRRTEPITFSLGLAPGEEGDPHTYTFNPPKAAVMLMPILDPKEDTNEGIEMTKATFDWLGQGLSDDDNARLLARLRDNNDDLDTETLTKVVEGLTEKTTGRPTG